MRKKRLRSWIACALSLCALGIWGCGQGQRTQQENAAGENAIELRMITMGNAPAVGMDAFYAQLDSLSVPELGVRVRIDFVPWGEELIRLPVAIESGEYDMISGGPWSNVTDYVTINAFADLTPYMNEVPELVAYYKEYAGEDFFSDMMNGGCYGLPEIIMNNNCNGILYRLDLCEAWGIGRIHTLEDLERYLYAAIENGYQYPITDSRLIEFVWEYLAADKYVDIPGVSDFVANIDDISDVRLKMETPEYLECVELITRWYQDGLVSKEILTGRLLGVEVLIAQDQNCIEICNHLDSYNRNYIPVIVQKHPEWELAFTASYEMNPDMPVFRVSPYTSMISVSGQSEHILESVRFLEKCHTDVRYARLMMYGVEGLSYYDVDGRISYQGIDASDIFSGVKGLSNYGQALSPLFENETWEDSYREAVELIKQRELQTKAVNPLSGFMMDEEGLVEILQRMQSYKNEVLLPLNCGMSENPAGELAMMVEEMKRLGADGIRENIVSQIEDWRSRTAD